MAKKLRQDTEILEDTGTPAGVTAAQMETSEPEDTQGTPTGGYSSLLKNVSSRITVMLLLGSSVVL